MAEQEPQFYTALGGQRQWCAVCGNLDPDCPSTMLEGSSVRLHDRPSLMRRRFFSFMVGQGTPDGYARVLDDFDRSAAGGCRICRVLNSALARFDPAKPSPYILVLRPNSPAYVLYERENDTTPAWIDFYAPAGSLPAWHGLPERRRLSQSALGGQAFEFIAACLETCVQKHQGCRQQTTCPPTRLLELSEQDTDRVFLFEPAQGAQIKYVALSYCWGQAPFFCSTRDNVNDLMIRGFEVGVLPPLFQEVVDIVRKLGLRHIWIDALCIIQRDATDWERESVRMRDVYDQAYLTIAAASSSSVYESLARVRGTVVEIEAEDDTGQSATVEASMRLKSGYHRQNLNIIHRSVTGSATGNFEDPWRLRAWTLQEELLSTRLIAFTRDELQWLCKTETSCECGHPPSLKRIVLPRHAETPPEVWLDFWINAVVTYTERGLTVAGDKFVAVWALAQHIQRLSGWQYVAGLWGEHMIYTLCWNRDAVHNDWHSPACDAPTFSWLSVQGKIRWGLRPDFELQASLVCVEPGAQSSGPYAGAKGSSVEIMGVLVEAELSQHLDRFATTNSESLWGAYEVNFADLKVDMMPDTVIDVVLAKASDGSSQLTGARSPRKASAKMMEAWKHPKCPVWLLLIGHDKDTQRVLVLGKSCDRPGCFERLGFSWISRKKELVFEGYKVEMVKLV